MKKMILFANLLILLNACGFKGDLYLPKENDKNQFGVIQTGLHDDFRAPNPQQPNQSETETKP